MKRIPNLAGIRRIFQTPTTDTVHFHRGPQGAPTPCYDSTCDMPHLAAEDR